MSLIWILIVATLCASDIARASKYYCSSDYSDYSKLALQWTPGLCSVRSCNGEQKNSFTIHGLWASQYSNFMSPSNCCHGASPDYQEIARQLPSLKEKWPSMFGSDENFWSKEWNKHGTCFISSLGTENETEYFKKTLELYDSIEPTKVMQLANIQPSSEVQSTESLRKAMTLKHDSKDIEVKCRGTYLTGISFCFDKDWNPKDCPWRGNCGEGIIIPKA